MLNFDWAVSWFALVGITNTWSFDAVLLEQLKTLVVNSHFAIVPETCLYFFYP